MSIGKKGATIHIVLAVLACIVIGSLAFILEIAGIAIAVVEPIISSGLFIGFILLCMGVAIAPLSAYLYSGTLKRIGMNGKTLITYLIVLNLFAIMVNAMWFIGILV